MRAAAFLLFYGNVTHSNHAPVDKPCLSCAPNPFVGVVLPLNHACHRFLALSYARKQPTSNSFIYATFCPWFLLSSLS